MKISEHSAQSALVAWAQLHESEIPVLRLLYAIPNGGARHAVVANKMKLEGVKSGVPDLCLPVARCGYNSLYIEMKVGRNKISENQERWLKDLTEQGSLCVIAWDWFLASDILAKYARGTLPHASTSRKQVYEIGSTSGRNKKTGVKERKSIRN